MRTLRLILTFYSSFVFVSFLSTLSCLSIIYIHGEKTLTALFWFKAVTLGMIYYVINSYKKREFYYYKNLGVSKRMLWIPTLSFDFFLFLVLMIITVKVR